MFIRGSFLIRVLGAAALLALATPARAVHIEVGYAVGLPGDEVTLDVVFHSEGAEIAGIQNDIGFDADAAIKATATLEPDCSVNPDIDKNESAFAFQPPGCVVGDTCTSVRALILSFSNVDPIPDGVLYTCRVGLAADAPPAPHFLPCSAAGVSTPAGIPLRATCRDGEVLLPGGTPRPTPTPTFKVEPTQTPTPTPTLLPVRVTIEIGYVNAEPGDEVVLDVVLRAAGVDVAATQNDLAFPPEARIPPNAAGRPDCTVNPSIDKAATSFTFQPPGCVPAVDCTAVRALVLAFDNVDPITDGAVLYSCHVDVTGVPGVSYAIGCSQAGASDPTGVALATRCRDGALLPPGVSEPPTKTPRPTATPITGEQRTRKPTSTRGSNPPTDFAPTPTATGDGPDDDGCAIGAAPHDGAWALLLLPALLLAARRLIAGRSP